jgi:hypothetical protein
MAVAGHAGHRGTAFKFPFGGDDADGQQTFAGF